VENLPKVCKDCAEYGSEFCHDCLEELSSNLSEPEKITLSRALQNIAKSLTDRED
jgi:hypothetical protein